MFLVFRRIGEYISLDLFYFVNLTSSCSLIPTDVKEVGTPPVRSNLSSGEVLLNVLRCQLTY